MKKRVKVVAIMLMIFTLSVGIISCSNNTAFNSITSKQFHEILRDTEQKIVYIGRPSCPDCTEVQPILEQVLEEAGVTAYYYNTEKAKKKSMDDFNEIKEIVDVQYVPTIIYYDGDKEISRIDYSDYTADNTVFEKLIEEYKSNTN